MKYHIYKCSCGLIFRYGEWIDINDKKYSKQKKEIEDNQDRIREVYKACNNCSKKEINIIKIMEQN
jgi:uncharacterized protein YjaG (DUF416 family)